MAYELLDKQGAADLLLVSVRKIDGMRKAGRLPFLKIGNQVRFRREALERWIDDLEKSQAGNAKTEALA